MIQFVVSMRNVIEHAFHLLGFLTVFVVRLDMLLWVIHAYLLKKFITFFSIRSAMLLVSSFTNFSPVIFSNNSM